MQLFEQLEFFAGKLAGMGKIVGGAVRGARLPTVTPRPFPQIAPQPGRDRELEASANEMLRTVGAGALTPPLRVVWNRRMRTAAGRADSRRNLISLNPLLRAQGVAEIDRTLRHELAHLVAHFCAGRRRINPHGPEWRRACSDLGIADEQRCHTLPFPARKQRRLFLYRCPACHREFPRVRRIRRTLACLPCCRQHNGGRYEEAFRLRLVRTKAAS